jgi:hypothetical protein
MEALLDPGLLQLVCFAFLALGLYWLIVAVMMRS